ncbi:hypothetical protein [Leptotrichia sp. oral taxon 847]|uniref:hypothetical protein n=1 Tax=Leptotrichia sp. oral taxon 847 TaxID=1785996 RepID=UPI0007682461|nr:hypothetical protein [Leptotrichia sp. oral taxon 847]AMD95604.1 hypothetical protein AXF11_08485 [Leptotrichia sp. oral taxon 847]
MVRDSIVPKLHAVLVIGYTNEWSLPKTKTPYVELQGLVSVPSYNAVTNDYSRNYDIFYRSISKEDYKILKNTGNLKGTGETSTSPNLGFTEDYTGIQLKFYTKQGTIGEMEKIGIRSKGNVVKDKYPDMPMPEKSPGRGYKFVRFKEEMNKVTRKKVINIQLGKGLEIFNKN